MERNANSLLPMSVLKKKHKDKKQFTLDSLPISIQLFLIQFLDIFGCIISTHYIVIEYPMIPIICQLLFSSKNLIRWRCWCWKCWRCWCWITGARAAIFITKNPISLEMKSPTLFSVFYSCSTIPFVISLLFVLAIHEQ